MKDKKICGIYQITNIENGHFYVGSSKQANVRWRHHRDALRHFRHHSIYLQRAWNKYGEEKFKFEILEECTLDQLLEREQLYIDFLKPAYNVEKLAGRPPVDPERSRKTMKAQWAAGQFDSQKRAIDRIDPNTGEVKEYLSMSIAEKDGFSQQSISACCLGNKASYANYFWQFSDGSSPEAVTKYQKIFYAVTGTSIATGEKIMLKSFEEANLKGFNSGKIRACCQGTRGRKTHKGYKWQVLSSEASSAP